jgi:hypothetical protein
MVAAGEMGGKFIEGTELAVELSRSRRDFMLIAGEGGES